MVIFHKIKIIISHTDRNMLIYAYFNNYLQMLFPFYNILLILRKLYVNGVIVNHIPEIKIKFYLNINT